MGQYASEPMVHKDSEIYENKKLMVGASSMQGWRINMEDYKTCLMSIPEDPGTSFFGVFDGHGGNRTAEYSSHHLVQKIVERSEYGEGNIQQAIENAYLELDDEMRHCEELKNDKSGTTAICVIIKNSKLYCANVGDSRGIICIKGIASPLSIDHKPSDPQEIARIESSGSFVSFDRVNGILAMSRALGDFSFKINTNLPPEKQCISPFPDVKTVDLTTSSDIDFVLLASDGIWDVLNNQQVADFVVSQAHQNRHKPHKICEQMIDKCLAADTLSPLSASGLDNMTIVLIVFLQPLASLPQTATTSQDKHNNSPFFTPKSSNSSNSPKISLTSASPVQDPSGISDIDKAYLEWCKKCDSYYKCIKSGGEVSQESQSSSSSNDSRSLPRDSVIDQIDKNTFMITVSSPENTTPRIQNITTTLNAQDDIPEQKNENDPQNKINEDKTAGKRRTEL
ncbi:probable protein phosphatase 2C T23F11.1 isoform X2 [Gordionus sp. m RMFG-2023]